MKKYLIYKAKNKFVKLNVKDTVFSFEKGVIDGESTLKSDTFSTKEEAILKLETQLRLHTKLGYEIVDPVKEIPTNTIRLKGEYSTYEYLIFDKKIVYNRYSIKPEKLTVNNEFLFKNETDKLQYLAEEKFKWKDYNYELLETDYNLENIPNLSLFDTEKKHLKTAKIIQGDLITEKYKANDFIVVGGNTIINDYFLLNNKTIKNISYGILYFKGDVKINKFLINSSVWFNIFIDGNLEVDTMVLAGFPRSLIVKGITKINTFIHYKENPGNVPFEGITNYIGITDLSDDEVLFKEKYRNMFGVKVDKIIKGLIKNEDIFLAQIFFRYKGMASVFGTEFFNQHFNQAYNYYMYAGFQFVTLNDVEKTALQQKYSFLDLEYPDLFQEYFHRDVRTDMGNVILHKSCVDALEVWYPDNTTLDLVHRFRWLLQLSNKKSLEENYTYWIDKKISIDACYQSEKENIKTDIFLALNWFILFSFFNDNRKDEIKPLLNHCEFNTKDMQSIESKVRGALDFFEVIGKDGNIEMKGKNQVFFKNKRAEAIAIYKQRLELFQQ